jgi:hypothetical protein
MPHAYGPLGRTVSGVLMAGQEPAQHIGATVEATAGAGIPETRANPMIDNAIKAPLKIFLIFFLLFVSYWFLYFCISLSQLIYLLSNRNAKRGIFHYIIDFN